MTKIKTLLSVCALTAVVSVQSQATSFEYVITKCGLGGTLFPKSNIGAAVSNIIGGVYSLSTTLTQVGDGSCNEKYKRVAMLIGASYDKLETEIAEGNGQYVSTLASLSGKNVSEIRAEFSKVATTAKYEKMTEVQKASELFNISVK